MTPDQALAEAEKGELRSIYLVAGEEAYLASAVVLALKAAALKGGISGLNEDSTKPARPTSIACCLRPAPCP